MIVDMPPIIVASPHGQHEPRYRQLGAQGDADETRDHQHDDRRVVNERAHNENGDQHEQQRHLRPFGPQPGGEQGHGLQRTRGLERLADNDQRANRDQCLVAETEQKLCRVHRHPVYLVRKEMEPEKQQDDYGKTRGFQRQPVTREQYQRDND